MKTRHSQLGFSIVEVALVVVVIAIVGFVGYMFYTNQINKPASDNNQTTDQSTAVNDVKSAPTITTTADLDAAQAALDQTDPDGTSSDTSQLDAELANF